MKIELIRLVYCFLCDSPISLLVDVVAILALIVIVVECVRSFLMNGIKAKIEEVRNNGSGRDKWRWGGWCADDDADNDGCFVNNIAGMREGILLYFIMYGNCD